jgi:large subunit ribosomal protein L20
LAIPFHRKSPWRPGTRRSSASKQPSITRPARTKEGRRRDDQVTAAPPRSRASRRPVEPTAGRNRANLDRKVSKRPHLRLTALATQAQRSARTGGAEQGDQGERGRGLGKLTVGVRLVVGFDHFGIRVNVDIIVVDRNLGSCSRLDLGRLLLRRFRNAKETTIRADAFAFAGRQQKKRMFRRLWITRLTAAAKAHGLRYSAFIHGVQKAGIKLNRKELSEMAIHDPAMFDAICDKARQATSQAVA